jgi:hypothetical protein
MANPDVATPVETPVMPAPTPSAWPDRYTDPLKICPDQAGRTASPDVSP